MIQNQVSHFWYQLMWVTFSVKWLSDFHLLLFNTFSSATDSWFRLLEF